MVAVDGAYVEQNHYIFLRAYNRVHSGIGLAMAMLNRRLDPVRRSVAHSYRGVKTGANRTLSKFRWKTQNKDVKVWAEPIDQSGNRFGPTYRRFQEGLGQGLSKFKRKRTRKRNALGKVVGFATQEIPKPVAEPVS